MTLLRSSNPSSEIHGLHGYSVSLTEHPKFFYFFWEAMFATPPIVLAGAIHTLLWKMRLEKCQFSLFRYGILPGSFCFRACCGDFPFRGCISKSLAYIHVAACLHICVLPAAFKKICSNQRGPVTGTSSAQNVMHL